MANKGPAAQYDKLDDLLEAQGKFKIDKRILISLVESYQRRYFSEEIDIIDSYGGEGWLKDGLMTSFQHGLPGDQEDLQERDHVYGNNKKPLHVPKSYSKLVWNGLQDITLKILIIAALASIAIDVGIATDNEKRKFAWIEGFAILTAVMVLVNANATNGYLRERQFSKLKIMADERKRVTVIRGGQKFDIHQTEVLVGDVVMIFEGMEIPADGFVIEASELTLDESAMTGVTDPVTKKTLATCIDKRDHIRKEGNENTSGPHDVPSPIMMSGSNVLTGEGKMLIIVVGDSSCAGNEQALFNIDEQEATPLQLKLAAIAEDIGKFGSYSALLIVFVMLLRFAIERGIQQDWDNTYIQQILGYFIIGITVVVVTNPKGLPLALTANLAYTTKQMLADQNLVIKTVACESMGSASMICTDKTGTLTQNKMSLVSVWNDEMISIDEYTPALKLNQYWNDEFSEYFIQAAIINCSAMLKPEPKGSRTEIALLEFLTRCSLDINELRLKYPSSLKFPFSPARKRMSMVLELEGGHRRLVCKGASELVLQTCSQYHSKTGLVIPLNANQKYRVENAIEKMANKGLRTICIAYKDISAKEDLTTKDSQGIFYVETYDLTLLGILGIEDDLKQEVPQAIRQCRKAGIKVRMITGENKLTAQAIAKECGIIQPGDQNDYTVIEGATFIEKIGGVVCKVCRTSICPCPRDKTTARQENREIRVDTIFDGPAFDKIYPQICVMARSRPEDKYALVTGLIERGHVVAVTGDGTKDALALKKADVGYAQGIAGTDVARESAAIILLDDNFNSIVKAVMWGRNVYDNIRKFIRFQLTANIVAVVLTLVGAALIRQEILRPIQMLWLNLIMDTLGSLALATEPPNEKVFDRKPYDRTEYIISKNMFKLIIGTALVMITVIFIIVFAGDSFLPEVNDDNSAFNTDQKLFWKFNDIKCTATNFNLKSTSPQCQDDNFANCFCRNLNECALIECEDNPCEGTCTKIRSGRLYEINGQYDFFWFFNKSQEPSRHFTYVFNIFIMLQIFNFLNARRFNNELNIFEGIFNHTAFLIIVPGIFVLQIIIVTFGSKAIGLYSYYGLTVQQWGICICYGAISLVAGFILKFIKEDMCCESGQIQIRPPAPEERGILQVKSSPPQQGFRRRYSSINL